MNAGQERRDISELGNTGFLQQGRNSSEQSKWSQCIYFKVRQHVGLGHFYYRSVVVANARISNDNINMPNTVLRLDLRYSLYRALWAIGA